MAQGKATDNQFGDLHQLVAESLIEQIEAWKGNRLVDLAPQKAEPGDPGVIEGKHGVLYVKVFPPALLAQAIKFLKDNGVDQPARSGNKVDTLKKAMPDFSDDDVIPFPNRDSLQR